MVLVCSSIQSISFWLLKNLDIKFSHVQIVVLYLGIFLTKKRVSLIKITAEWMDFWGKCRLPEQSKTFSQFYNTIILSMTMDHTNFFELCLLLTVQNFFLIYLQPFTAECGTIPFCYFILVFSHFSVFWHSRLEVKDIDIDLFEFFFQRNWYYSHNNKFHDVIGCILFFWNCDASIKKISCGYILMRSDRNFSSN